MKHLAAFLPELNRHLQCTVRTVLVPDFRTWLEGVQDETGAGARGDLCLR
jgi:hypothetical protein